MHETVGASARFPNPSIAHNIDVNDATADVLHVYALLHWTAAVIQVVVVGGGWAGFGAASQLASAGVKVTLLEAQPSAGGLAAGWETAKGNR